jgi:hypothetical protein
MCVCVERQTDRQREREIGKEYLIRRVAGSDVYDHHLVDNILFARVYAVCVCVCAVCVCVCACVRACVCDVSREGV